MTIMIRDIELMAGCFCFLLEFKGFLYFLGCTPRILGGITWRAQKELPISNSKIAPYAKYIFVFHHQAICY
jgi:hypothetical protein